MPPPPVSRDASKRPITVYVTGFGVRSPHSPPPEKRRRKLICHQPIQPFRKFTTNPSWEIAASFLPSTQISSDIYKINIVPHPEFVRVAYQTVDTLIPQIHAQEKFDYILHIGVGLPGGYEIETVAHEKGYVKADVDGLIPGGVPADPEKEKKNGSGDTGKDNTTETDGGEIYRTELDVDGICSMIDACRIIVRSLSP